MVLASFQIGNKLERSRFFQETFLLTNINMEVVLSIAFLILSNADVQFVEKKLTWRSYTATKALPTTKQVELINNKEFAKVALDENFETYVIYMASHHLAPKYYPDKKA